MSEGSTHNSLIVILGPTAIGKTTLGIQIAQTFNSEIISSDSRQFFREMTIGTAKPSQEELAAVKHHFIDTLSVQDEYSAGQFERDGLKLLDTLFAKSNVAVMVGGSGLYVDAVCRGFDDLPKSTELRHQINEQFEKEGINSLQQQLIALDPDIAAIIDLQNPQRVTRALEVCLASGKTYSSFRSNSSKKRPFKIIKIALDDEREVIYDRINSRVDHMVQNGLIEEVRSLLPYKDLNALNTVGYKELFDHFEGKMSLEETIEKIKQNTRRFAKRQLTWLRRDQDVHWFKAGDTDSVISFCKAQVKI